MAAPSETGKRTGSRPWLVRLIGRIVPDSGTPWERDAPEMSRWRSMVSAFRLKMAEKCCSHFSLLDK